MQKNPTLIALLDEYQKTASEFLEVIKDIQQPEFTQIKDVLTNDSDCKSIQTISSHVVNSGYTYANYINAFFNIPWWNFDRKRINSVSDVLIEMPKMLKFTEQSFDGLWEKTDDEIIAMKVKARWGPTYDIEQLLEHAIVHILRHRRQIENFIN